MSEYAFGRKGRPHLTRVCLAGKWRWACFSMYPLAVGYGSTPGQAWRQYVERVLFNVEMGNIAAEATK